MGCAIAMAPCVGCGEVFSFNPHKVPSLPIEGERRPVCLGCVRIANPRRIANGLKPIEVLPGAYEPIDESDL